MPNLETREKRPSLPENQLPEISRFLEYCDYRLLPADDGPIKFVRNLDGQNNYPRFDLTLFVVENSQQVSFINLHQDRRKHRTEKRFHQETEEIKRILDQLATFKPLSPELKVFGNALRHFSLFGAGESVRREQEVKGDSYLKELLNHRRRQHRKRREGRERRKEREKDWRKNQF